jgi:hypothetical protein
MLMQARLVPFHWELINDKVLLVFGHLILILLKGFWVIFMLVTGLHGWLLLSMH